MKPCNREMQATNSILNQQQQQSPQMSLQHHQHLQDGGHDQQIQTTANTGSPYDPAVSASHDDFLEQMLSSLPSSCSWPSVDLSNPPAAKPSPWGLSEDQGPSNSQNGQIQFHFDDSALLASKLQQHQISSGGGGGGSVAAAAAAVKSLLLQQQLLLARGLSSGGGLRSPTGATGAGESGLFPMPMSLGREVNGDSFDRSQNDIIDPSSFKSHNPGGDGSVQALYNGFGQTQTSNQSQHFHHSQGGSMPGQNFAPPATAAVMSQAAASGSVGGGAAPPGQLRQRVRARRGQATDPHSIAERLRRERIAERMKALQEIVPNANKTDKASMLDEIIDYVKFLQLQVKVLSMSRLGGAAAVAPLVADISSQGGDSVQGGRSNNGAQTAPSSSNESMTVTEQQVAKLMEEDMGSAMQYLQGKGLCLMPISLATAISTATCHTRNPLLAAPDGPGGPSSPSMSVLTVQSATLGNGGADLCVKDATSISKP